MDLVTDFFDSARSRIESIVQPAATNFEYQETESSGLSGAIYNAIYQFGAGKAEQARDTLTAQFMKTGEGQRLQQSGIRTTIAQYAPLIFGLIIVAMLMGVTVGRR